jgi:hypothetical protein
VANAADLIRFKHHYGSTTIQDKQKHVDSLCSLPHIVIVIAGHHGRVLLLFNDAIRRCGYSAKMTNQAGRQSFLFGWPYWHPKIQVR